MRQVSKVTAVVWIAAIVALFGASSMIAKVPQRAGAAAASVPIDIAKLTRDANNLPIEQYDAH
jgi:hypothetical protein